MRGSSATETTRLLNPWALAAVALAVSGLLWATFEREQAFAPDERAPDAVSANYAELLLAAHPEDDQLRVQLVQLLIQLGDYPKARLHLDNWAEPQPALQAFYRLELDALEATKAGDPAVQAQLVKRLEALDQGLLPVAQLQDLARLALSVQAPALAARVFEVIAKREPQQRSASLLAAAQWHLAGEQPGRAADIYLQLKQGVHSAEQRRPYARQAFDSLLAAGRGEEAAQVLAEELEGLKDPQTDPPWLEQGVKVAVQSKRFDLAQRILGQWRVLQPDNGQILIEDFNLRLAFGDLSGAWQCGEQLLREHPQDPYWLEQMARLGEWRQAPDAALDYWIRLLALRETEQIREHAWRLASQQGDFQRLIPLLADISRQRALTDAELDALIYSHESLGSQAQAGVWLQVYVRQYPRHRKAWTRLLQNLENNGQFASRAQVYKDLSKRFALTLSERVDWAATYLRLADPQAAWNVLQVDSSGIRDEGYWRARAILAWNLKLDGELRVALETLLSLKGTLDQGDESQLITLYGLTDPRRALSLAISSWQRSHDPLRLVQALQQAEALQDWPQVVALLQDAEAYPATYDQAPVLAIRGALAVRQGDIDEAQRLYLSGVSRFPADNLFRERLLWLYVDQGRTAELKPLLSTWRSLARQDSRLWLAFASASQMIGHGTDALAWYRLYLKASPHDWLVQAAYADALHNAGYEAWAQRLRLKLLRSPEGLPVQPLAQQYAVWLRLMASSYSPRAAQQQALQWQDGSPALLSLWFERLLARLDATNQVAQKDQWLEWAKAQGLKVERYEQIQQALRSRNLTQVKSLLARSDLDPAQRTQALVRLGRLGQALDLSLSALGDEQPAIVREQLRRQAADLQERMPQGAKLSWRQQDFGGLQFKASGVQVAHNLGDQWYADLQLEQGTYQASSLIASRLGQERNAALTLQRQVQDGRYTLSADTSQRQDEDRIGLALARTWQLDARDALEAGVDWQRKSEDSGLMRAFGQHDSLWLAGRHGLSARDQISWQVAHQSFSTRAGDALGSGQALKLEYGHRLQFAGPSWTLRSGVDYQHNRLDDRPLDALSASHGGAIIGLDNPSQAGAVTASDLLQSRYGQLYVGSAWSRSLPSALVRTSAQYSWLVDVAAGWQWTDQTFNYGINTGIGMQVLGNDQLALTIGYQSAPQGGDGQAGGTLGVSYGVRFGR